MKKRWYLVVGIVVILVVGVALFFLSGDRSLQDYIGESAVGDRGGVGVGDSEGGDSGVLSSEGNDIVSGVGGISGDSGGGGGGSSSGGTNCVLQQIEYSLKNFKKSVGCVETSVVGCVRLQANCSMEVHNLNEETPGVFRLRYSLVNSGGDALETEIIERNVVYGDESFEIFSVNFEVSDELGVDEGSTCPFVMESVPQKEIC